MSEFDHRGFRPSERGAPATPGSTPAATAPEGPGDGRAADQGLGDAWAAGAGDSRPPGAGWGAAAGPPVGTRAATAHGWPFRPVPGAPPVTGRDGIGALIVVIVAAALGAALAPLWSAVGPHVELIRTPLGPDLTDYNTEAFLGGDLSFAAITVVAGALLGGAAFALRRWRGPLMVVALAVGCLAGAWITWKLGSRIGLAEYKRLLDDASVGQRFEQPMRLRAEGLVFLEAIAAVIVYVAGAAWSHRPNLGATAEPDPDRWLQPTSPATLAMPWPPAAPGVAAVSSDPSGPASPPAAPAPPADGSASSPPA